jgi:ABC-type multidrug transport system fused ATPase/permease subunit
MKLSKSFSKILENKYVLYIVFFLAVTNLFSYMVANNNTAVAFFIVTAVLIYYFNKNMILVLGVPLILTSIFAVGKYKHTCRKHRQKLEGMKSMGKEGNENMKDKDGQGGEDEEEGMANNGDDEGQGGKGEGEEEPKPEPDPEPEKFSGINNKKNNRIDYAATVEDAYSDLSKVLGGDGIKNLTSDTQKLMKQQLQLAEAMQSMTPLLEQAKSLIGGFDMKNFDGIASLAKNLNMPVPGQ